MELEVRPCRDRAEFARALYGIWQYFNAPPAEETLDRWLSSVGQERMHAALDDGEVVGGAGRSRSISPFPADRCHAQA